MRPRFRGERPLGETTRLSFRCQTDAAKISVVLVNTKAKTRHVVEAAVPKQGGWRLIDVGFADARGAADEVHWLLPAGSELLLDDVVLYE